MKKVSFICSLFVFASCDSTGSRESIKADPTGSADTLTSTELNEPGPTGVHLSFITVTCNDSASVHLVEWGVGHDRRLEDLATLTQGEGYRLMPSLQWHNQDYICLMTNHSGPFSQHLFLPLHDSLPTRFYARDVEHADSLDNFVCVIDSAGWQGTRVYWTLERLRGGKAEHFESAICPRSTGYPWHYGIERLDSVLKIKAPCEPGGLRSISISQYATPLK
jgi:hypothetical protein